MFLHQKPYFDIDLKNFPLYVKDQPLILRYVSLAARNVSKYRVMSTNNE